MGNDSEKTKKNSWYSWLKNVVDEKTKTSSVCFGPGYLRIADKILQMAGVKLGDYALDLGTGTGLLAFEAAKRVGSQGRVVGIDLETTSVEECDRRAASTGVKNASFLAGDAICLPFQNAVYDTVVFRSVLCHILNKKLPVQEMYRVLKKPGRFSFFEPVDRYDTLFSELVDFSILGKTAQRLRQAEEEIHKSPFDSLMNFDEHDLYGILSETGFINIRYEIVERTTEHRMTACHAKEWWQVDIGGIAVPGHRSPYQLLREYLPKEELDSCMEYFCKQVDGKTIVFRSKQVYMWGEK